jgi:hypothetical protein
MARFPRHSPAPWLRSIDESLPPDRDHSRRVTPVALIATLIVVVAAVAMALWFLVLATGGPGPGTV